MLCVGFFSFAVCVVVQFSDRFICCDWAISCAVFSACALVIFRGGARVGAWFQLNRMMPTASRAMIAAYLVLFVVVLIVLSVNLMFELMLILLGNI